MKFIKPKPIKQTDIRRAIEKGMQATMEVVKVDFIISYATWEDWPTWVEVGPRKQGFDLVHIYSTSSVPYVWVDKGTGTYGRRGAPYPITARNVPMLRYQAHYIPRSKPGQLMSGMKAKYGNWVNRFQVMHPGIEPRLFSEKVAERADKFLSGEINSQLGAL